MGDRVDTIAAALIDAGATEESPIGVFQQPGADWICSMLAVWKIGAVYIPLDLRNSIVRLASVVRAARPTMMLTDRTTTSSIRLIGAGDAVEMIVSDLPPPSGGFSSSASSRPPLPNRAKPSSVAVVLFTSGTTGRPKGILMTHANLRAESEAYSRACNIPSVARVVLQQTIYSFDVSLDQIIAGLADGGCLVIVPAEKRGDPLSITQMMIEHGVTYTVATPSEYDMWFRYTRENLARCSTWRAAFGGGEHLHRALIQEFSDLARELPNELRLFNNYGPTEATLAITKGEVKHSDPDLEHHVPAGRILPNYTVVVLDEHLRPVPAGVAGEICAGGPGITNGYLGLEEATRESFVPGTTIHPSAAKLSATWYRTGDRGRLSEDGQLYWLGRIAGDNQVKIRGFRIELEEVETVLVNTAGGALSHAVVTARGEGESKFLAAHVVFAPDFPAHRRQGLIQHLESRLPLPPYMHPSVIVPIANIPVTGNFKFDRQAIQALPLPDQSADMALVSSIERQLAELWRRVMPHNIGRELTPETSFFDVGGHSILLVKLQSLIRAELHSAPRLVDLMNFSTIGGMAKVVKAFTGRHAIDWEEETGVPESIVQTASEDTRRARSHLPGSKTTNMAVVLAGSTGYLGRHLLRRLVETPRVGRVLCLVRDETAAASSDPSFLHPKVELLPSDLSEPNLGLSTSAFAALAARQPDAVIHCAADRSFFDSYEALQAVNVGSVKEAARLALAGASPRPVLHFVSSGAVREYDGSAPPADGSNGYVASKWAAETFLRKAAARCGLQVHIHRPLPVEEKEEEEEGVVVEDVAAGRSGELTKTTRATPVLDNLLAAIRSLGSRPDLRTMTGYLDLAPVDEVVEAMVADMLATVDAAPGAHAGGGRAEEAGGVEVVAHRGRLRLLVEDLAGAVESDALIAALPPVNPLVWFADAKKAGFDHFMSSHHLVMSSADGKVIVRR